MICAFTHHLAGVHPDDIMADYLLTNDESRIGRKMDFLGPWLRDTAGKIVSDAALRVAVSVSPDYLMAAFDTIRQTSGSLDAYLEQVLGCTPVCWPDPPSPFCRTTALDSDHDPQNSLRRHRKFP